MSHTESAAPTVLICIIVCAVIVIAITMIRLYTRVMLVKALGSDDYILLFGIVVWFAVVSLFGVAPKYGLGMHIADVNPNYADEFVRLMVVAAALYNTVMLACKLSILLLYRRLFPVQNFIKAWWCVTVFTVSYSVVIAVASACGRTPVAAKWHASKTENISLSGGAFYIANAVFNLTTDLLLLILPIPVIWNLSLELKQKVTLSILFALGSSTVIVSIVRLEAMIAFLRTETGDITFETVRLVNWCLIETTISIVCVCAPALRPFFRRYCGTFFSWSGSDTDSNNHHFSAFFHSKHYSYGRRSSSYDAHHHHIMLAAAAAAAENLELKLSRESDKEAKESGSKESSRGGSASTSSSRGAVMQPAWKPQAERDGRGEQKTAFAKFASLQVKI